MIFAPHDAQQASHILHRLLALILIAIVLRLLGRWFFPPGRYERSCPVVLAELLYQLIYWFRSQMTKRNHG